MNGYEQDVDDGFAMAAAEMETAQSQIDGNFRAHVDAKLDEGKRRRAQADAIRYDELACWTRHDV